MKVIIHFSGAITVTVPDGLTEDSDGWTDAIAKAWADTPAADISEAASADEAEPWEWDPDVLRPVSAPLTSR